MTPSEEIGDPGHVCDDCATTCADVERMAKENAQLRRDLEVARSALMAAQLHLLVRPHMRMPEAEANLKAFISAALSGSLGEAPKEQP